MSDNQKWEIIHGDALKVLSSFAPGTFDAVITDPPYASGGRTPSEKSKSTVKKYSSMKENAPPPFDGDAKDQRSWTRWAAEWLYEARKASKPGAPVCLFIVWGSNGDMPISRPVPCLPGVFKYGNPQNRIHLTEKPLQLMQDIVKITESGGHILDPFAGSGTTVLAAVLEGYSATGIEMSDVYADLAKERIKTELEKVA